MAKSLLGKLSQMVGLTEAASPEDYCAEVIDAMAEEMTPRDGVDWAVQSARKVDPEMLSEEDLAALDAAEAWAADPCEESVAACEAALKDIDYQGPGAFAALAAISAPAGSALAAGAGGAGAGVAAAPAAATAAGIAPKAVAGAVKLSAALANGQKPAAIEAAEASEADDADTAAAAAEPADDSDPDKTAEALKPYIDNGREIMQRSSSAG